MINLLILEEKNICYEKLNTLEILLCFPLTILRNIGDEDWRANGDRDALNNIKQCYRRYLFFISKVSSRIFFYKNIIFYRELEPYCSIDVITKKVLKKLGCEN